jgi:hypothetical protein
LPGLSITGVYVQDDLLILANQHCGFSVLQYTGTTRIEESFDSENLPKKYTLYQNHPNPFNPETTIRFDMPRESLVSLEIYNMTGQLVRTFRNRKMTAGYHKIHWDGRDDRGVDLSSGVYFYRLRAGGFSRTRKMVFLK